MQQFFEEIRRDGESRLQSLIDQQTSETIDLEFKTKTDSTHGKFDRKDQENFGRTLCAMSNSMGGLLIYGVAARKGDGDIDCAQTLCPITNIKQFVTQARTLCAHFLMPRHDGIFIEAISTDNDPSSGYMIVLVRRSERRPHRCEVSGDKHYYKRVGDSSIAMEHYDIEDAFNRFHPPALEFDWHVQQVSSGDGPEGMTASLQIALCIENKSSVSGRYPYLNVRNIRGIREPEYGSFIDPHVGLSQSVYRDWRCFAGGVDKIVHPTQSLVAAALNINLALTQGNFFTHINGEKIRDPMILEFDIQIGCEHSRMSEHQCVINMLDVQNAVRKVLKTR